VDQVGHEGDEGSEEKLNMKMDEGSEAHEGTDRKTKAPLDWTDQLRSHHD
jgi:hypothetical protein